jgi:hypothetical protein
VFTTLTYPSTPRLLKSTFKGIDYNFTVFSLSLSVISAEQEEVGQQGYVLI